MFLPTVSKYGHSLFKQKSNVRPIFQWLNIIFNRIDHQRVQEFGPDRVCAEWLLRNGGSVQWTGSPSYVKDYNSLPREGSKFLIAKIDATGSSISHYGFLHLRGCEHIREIILDECSYLEDSALKQLSFVKNSLEHLEVSNCGNITDHGVLHLKDLSKLKTLQLYNLPSTQSS
ncbi:uncharacterized protein CBL_07618 [Carabus blaptoides fortunei]